MKRKIIISFTMFLFFCVFSMAEENSVDNESFYSLNFRKYPNQDIYAKFEYPNQQVLLSIDESHLYLSFYENNSLFSNNKTLLTEDIQKETNLKISTLSGNIFFINISRISENEIKFIIRSNVSESNFEYISKDLYDSLTL